MAGKAIAVEEDRVETMTFQIEGLREVNPGIFDLSGVKILNVEWPKIEMVLRDAGIEQNDAIAYTERFANEVIAKQLAETLAKRMKRVG